MKKIFSFLKKLDHRHYVSFGISIGLVLWAVFFCKESFIRIWESAIDFGNGILNALFYDTSWRPDATVNDFSSVNVYSILPKEFEVFCQNFKLYFEIFFLWENFKYWGMSFLSRFSGILQLILVLFLVFRVLYLILGLIKPQENTSTGEATKSAQRFWKIEDKVLLPLYRYLKSYRIFYSVYRVYPFVFYCYLALIWNIPGLVLSFLAYYFYILASLSFDTLYIQIYKLTVDILVTLSSMPWPCWVFVGCKLFDIITRNIGYSILDLHEARNMAFLRDLGQMIFINGQIRSGKTSLMTDMQISQARVYREESLDTMLKMMRWFPAFPWKVFVKKILSNKKNGKIKNFPDVEKYIRYLASSFLDSEDIKYVFGYNFQKYGLFHDDGLIKKSVFNAMEIFAEAFLVFLEPTYFISSYSIREDHIQLDKGNMPLWDMDIFHRPSWNGDGHYSHIINFDAMRPGKQMDPSKKSFGCYEFGIFGIAEYDKERENQTYLKEIRFDDETCNQKNDLHAKYLKMMGHSSMVDFKCYIRLFSDAQRAPSLSADIREGMDILNIEEESGEKIAMPFFLFREMLELFVKKLHKKWSPDDMYRRGDVNLPMYLFGMLSHFYLDYCEQIHNTFGYFVLELSRQSGKEDSPVYMHKYYKAKKKIFSGRFSTASYESYFREFSAKADIALSDMPTYQTLYPTLEELAEHQNSFFMNSFLREK